MSDPFQLEVPLTSENAESSPALVLVWTLPSDITAAAVFTPVASLAMTAETVELSVGGGDEAEAPGGRPGRRCRVGTIT